MDGNQVSGAVAIANNYLPDIAGAKRFKYIANLNAATDYTIDMALLSINGEIEDIQTIFVDNYDGLNPLFIDVQYSNQRIVVGAGKQMIVPVFCPRQAASGSRFILNRADAGAVAIHFLNVALPSMEWPLDASTTDPQLTAILAAITANGLAPNTATRTSVADTASDVQLLASNLNRKGATIYNDSTVTLYVALGTAAASLTDFSVLLVAGAYYELPLGNNGRPYTGEIRGIWASNASGSARITELT